MKKEKLEKMAKTLKVLSPRSIEICKLRAQGLSFREIGKRIALTSQRVSDLYHIAITHDELQSDWRNGMSARLLNALNNYGIVGFDQAMAAYLSGILAPGSKKKPRNYGWKSIKELAQILGLPEPQRQSVLPPNFYIKPQSLKFAVENFIKAEGSEDVELAYQKLKAVFESL